jgi:hypothetical protein
MNTQAIRDYVEGTTSIRNLALAVLEIAAALDALDERTRPGGALGEQMRDEESEREWEKLQAEGTPAPSTIPGCYCGKCRHAQFAGEGKYWRCALLGSPGYAVVSGAMGFGCTLGERRDEE